MLPMDEQWIYAVGTASGADSIQAGREAARNSAAAQLAAYVGMDIESGFDISTRHDDRLGTNTTVSALSSSRTAARLLDVDIVDEYSVRTTRVAGHLHEERFDVNLLCRYRKSNAAEERLRKDTENQRLAASALGLFIEATQNSVNEPGQIVMAKLADARGMLDKVPDSTPLPDNSDSWPGGDAASLKREVSLELERIRALCRSVEFSRGRNPFDSDQESIFQRELGKTLVSSGLGTGADSRYDLIVDIGDLIPGGIVFGKRAVSLSYSWEILDRWNGGRPVSSGAGVARGFGRDFDSAVDEVARITGSQTGQEVAASLSGINLN